MGCSSSKHFKEKQRLVDVWISSPTLMMTPIPSNDNADQALHYYHQHYLALTASHGVLDFANTTTGMQHSSLSDMYEKLRSLETASLSCELKNRVQSSLNVGKNDGEGQRIGSGRGSLSENGNNVKETMRGSVRRRNIDRQKILQVKDAAALRELLAKRNEQDEFANQNNDRDHRPNTRGVPQRSVSLKRNPLQSLPLQEFSSTIRAGMKNTDLKRANNSCASSMSASNGFVRPTANINHGNNNKLSLPVCAGSMKSTNLIGPKESRVLSMSASSGVARRATVNMNHRSENDFSLPAGAGMTDKTDLNKVLLSMSAANGNNGEPTTNTDHRSKKKNLSALSIPPRSASELLIMNRGNVSSSPGPQSPLFEAELVASFEEELARAHEADRNKPDSFDCPGDMAPSFKDSGECVPNVKLLDRKLYDPFEGFQKRCPPAGDMSLVLYTTSLRGIKKTFDDCNAARDILQSFGVRIDERDVSMHLEFLNELRGLMGRMVTVPRIFIKGWYIGGVQEVSTLHEDGKLNELLVDLPKVSSQEACHACDGVRFVPCSDCRGSCKIRHAADDMALRCPKCNENGLIQCPLCSTHLMTIDRSN